MKHARDFFTAFEWWMLVPHRDWLRVDGEPASPPTESDITPPHCAATMGQVYVIYIPAGNGGRTITITHLAGETYHARWYNPRDGSYREMNGGIPINTGQKEEWTLPPTPDDRDDEDWVCHVNIITHAIAKTYGLYDIRYPEATPGFGHLVDEKIGTPIGANWRYVMRNFALPPEARVEFFGYYTDILSNALDMARLGWLWCNWGRWQDRQLIPEEWLREATRTAPHIRANCPQEQWKYGYAFWTNEHGQLLPDLPHDSYAASGMYGIALIWICPSLDLVVAHNPGLFLDRPIEAENQTPGLLKLIVDACV